MNQTTINIQELGRDNMTGYQHFEYLANSANGYFIIVYSSII